MKAGLFERWIAWFVLLTLIHWISIYPVDSVILLLNNWGMSFKPAAHTPTLNKAVVKEQ